ncbi:HpcH/HpaI aldolase/citrate lyase family protein [Rhodococcus sp. NPDC060176]|uniref:HpcH/HpaI aldolase family protein n=1 Tax=Rhodococcus sp. NPDC060176 TaxID=3347062 RepID=UPI0036686753
MLRPNEVRLALAEGRTVYGLFCAIPSPSLVEMIGCAGYDFVIVDTEHTGVDPQELENLIRAAESVALTPFVRVPKGDSGAILRALDAGAMGVVIPHVQDAETARAAVYASRYAPEGMRSLNSGRQPGFGELVLTEYISRANAEIMVVVMIEDKQAVEAIDSILKVPGIDMVLEGAADLSQSYGVPWQIRHPQVLDALAHIAKRSQAHNVRYCAIPRTPDDHSAWLEQGVRCFVLGEDRSVTARALRAHLNIHRSAEGS